MISPTPTPDYTGLLPSASDGHGLWVAILDILNSPIVSTFFMGIFGIFVFTTALRLLLHSMDIRFSLFDLFEDKPTRTVTYEDDSYQAPTTPVPTINHLRVVAKEIIPPLEECAYCGGTMPPDNNGQCRGCGARKVL